MSIQNTLFCYKCMILQIVCVFHYTSTPEKIEHYPFSTDLWPPLSSLVQNILSTDWVGPIVRAAQGQVKGIQPRLDSFVTGSGNKADFSRDGAGFMGQAATFDPESSEQLKQALMVLQSSGIYEKKGPNYKNKVWSLSRFFLQCSGCLRGFDSPILQLGQLR